jgi:hypothetical protein
MRLRLGGEAREKLPIAGLCKGMLRMTPSTASSFPGDSAVPIAAESFFRHRVTGVRTWLIRIAAMPEKIESRDAERLRKNEGRGLIVLRHEAVELLSQDPRFSALSPPTSASRRLGVRLLSNH